MRKGEPKVDSTKEVPQHSPSKFKIKKNQVANGSTSSFEEEKLAGTLHLNKPHMKDVQVHTAIHVGGKEDYDSESIPSVHLASIELSDEN